MKLPLDNTRLTISWGFALATDRLIFLFSQTTASPTIGADYNSISTLVSFSGGDGPLTLSQPPIQIAIIDDNNVN